MMDHQIVFPEHRGAVLLCDVYGSCVTDGHMVLFNFAPMMMSTYYDKHARCSLSTMFVNSPKDFTRKLLTNSTSASFHGKEKKHPFQLRSGTPLVMDAGQLQLYMYRVFKTHGRGWRRYTSFLHPLCHGASR